jgi:transcriptional regulator with XRE-family HTH domain
MESLHDMREDRLLTQGELARRVGVSESQYNRIERGHRMPRVKLIRKLAKFFGVDASRLREHLLEQTQGTTKA